MLRFTERIGSASADSFNMQSFEIAFGLEGDDTFQAGFGQGFSIAMGGPGNDTYEGAEDSALTVLDADGDDTVVADSVGLTKSSSFAFTVDNGQHLVFGDSVSGETVYLLNWQAPDAAIETIQLADTTVSTGFVQDNRDSLISGDVTWKEVSSQNPDASQVNEALDFYTAREDRLLNGVEAPERSEAPNLLVLSGEDQTVDAVGSRDVRGTSATETLRVRAGAEVQFGSGEGDRVEFADTLSAYDLSASGNTLTISDGDTTAEIALNAATEIAFADGAAVAEIAVSDGSAQVTVGGVSPGDDIDLDSSDPSSLAGGTMLGLDAA